MEMTSPVSNRADNHGMLYTLWFAVALSVVGATLVSSAYVTLRSRQQANELLARQMSVLVAAGLMTDEERLTKEEIQHHFDPFEQVAVDLRTAEEASDIDPRTFDQRAATRSARESHAAPDNMAGLMRLPHHAIVYKLMNPDGCLNALVLPIEGKGLWSTLYGFVALDSDLVTIRGLTFYQHGETPGLGGEVDNPRWKALWTGRWAFDERGEPAIEVIKGRAGPASDDRHRVDGLSGATLTGRGVTNLVRFWLGRDGFGPYLDTLRKQRTNVDDRARCGPGIPRGDRTASISPRGMR